MSEGGPFGNALATGDAPEPPTTAHKTIGILNILFSTVLLLLGACCGLSLLSQLALSPAMEAMQQQVQQELNQSEAKRKKEIATLDEQEKAATTEQEKATIKSAREALESQTRPVVPQFDYSATMRDPRILGFGIGDVVTGLLLNLLMLASGVGLLRSRSWARKTGVWIAALKLARLVLLYGYAIAVVGPLYSQKMSEMMEQMAAQMPQKGGGPPPQVAQSVAVGYTIMMTACFALMMVFGSIYPAISLWVLTRLKVKRACGEIPSTTSI